MVNDTVINATIHVNDETKIEAQRVPSELRDFVSLKIGWQVGVLLHTTSQAKALYEAAVDAYATLKSIEDKALVDGRSETEYNEWLQGDSNLEETRTWEEYCSEENPCRDCLIEMQ